MKKISASFAFSNLKKNNYFKNLKEKQEKNKF